MWERAVIYARVSTDEQTKGYSLPTQLEACRKYCAEKGYLLLAEFQDDCSGTEIDRPGLAELRAKASEGGIDVVVVYDVDRLARNTYFHLVLEQELAEHGARIEYVLGQYQDTPEGQLLKRIKADIAEYENAQRAERSRRGKYGRAKSGYVTLSGGHVPYGYSYISEPHKGRLEINEQEALIVRQIFHWVADEGMSAWAVSRKLSELGIPTRADLSSGIPKKAPRGRWSPTTVVGMIRNSVYKGVWCYGKTRMERRGGKPFQVPRPESEWIKVPVPAIVDEDTWERAQRVLARGKEKARRNMKRPYLLRGMVFCKCGRRWTGIYRQDQQRGYYRCSSKPHSEDGSPCSLRKSIRQEILEEAVWNAVGHLLLNPETLQIEIARRRAMAEEERERKLRELESVQKQIQEVERQLGLLLDELLRGAFPRPLVEQKKAELLARKEMLQKETERIEAELNLHAITPEQEREVLAFAQRVAKGLDKASFRDKRRILELLEVRVDVEDHLTVYLSASVIPRQIVKGLR